MVRVSLGGAAAVFVVAWAGGACAQTSSSQNAPAPAASDQNTLSDVVIEAVRPGVVRRIDRDVYDIKDDPQAKAAPLIDILGKLPAVSVGGDGKVRLLGTPGVTVLFDGKPVQGADQKLQTLTGADVEHIEVMTNPSSQFGATGAGGIINIVTRKHYKPGWSGQVGMSANNSDGLELRVAPTLNYGRWTFSGGLSLTRSKPDFHTSDILTRLAGDGTVLDTRTEDGRSQNDAHQTTANLKIAYKLADKQTLTLSGSLWFYDPRGASSNTITSTTATPYAERVATLQPNHDRNGSLTYEREGPRDGETLTLDLTYGRWNQDSDKAFIGGADDGSARYRLRTTDAIDQTTAKADYERPIGTKLMLTSGGSWERLDEAIANSLDNPSGLPALGPSSARTLSSRSDTRAGYATFQFPVLGWTVLPGLRFEDVDFDVRVSSGAFKVRYDDWFPSLHLSRDLPKDVKLKLSYSRRTDRPWVDMLDPTVVYSDSRSGQAGNPDLQPRFTDAYEAKLTHTHKATSLDLTLYDRETHGDWQSQQTLTSDDVLVSTYVNAGDLSRRGAQGAVRGPLIGRLKYVATANVYQLRSQVLQDGALRGSRMLTYDGSLQLDYKTAAANSAEAQQWQLTLKFYGPQEMLQHRSAASFSVDATWRWPVTKTVSSVLTVTDLLNTAKSSTRYWGDDFLETTETRQHAPRIRLALTYQFGGKP